MECVNYMTSEEAVTDILMSRAILNRTDDMVSKLYTTSSKYDLTKYLKNYKSEPSRFGPKYIFVK